MVLAVLFLDTCSHVDLSTFIDLTGMCCLTNLTIEFDKDMILFYCLVLLISVQIIFHDNYDLH